LNKSKPFYKLDNDIQMLIRERHPKLQTEVRSSTFSQQEDGKIKKDNS
jgi:hypothetical protein